MSWVTVIWSMIASACFTLAAIYLMVWYRNRTAWAPLLFAVTAASTTAMAFCELAMMRAATPGQLAAILRWAHVPLFVWVVSIAWFVHVYLGSGRRWLLWIVCGSRACALWLNFIVGQNLNFREVTARHIQFLGEPITVFGGVVNPWTLVGHLSNVLLLAFVADAGLSAWRRGDRRRALMIAGTIEFFVLFGFGQSLLIYWANFQIPITLSVLYMGLISTMGYELSVDVLRASQLVDELRLSEAGLRESEARMNLAVDAADFGIWIRDLARDDIWASEKWRELFGFAPSAPLDFSAILNRLHADDRDGLHQAHATAIADGDGGRYQTEFRLVMPDGATRWISSLGRVECDAAGRPAVIRGASRDITARKHAEQETQLLRQEIAHAGRVSAMGQLASSLAHEINQPLTAILSNAQAAERYLQQASPDLDEVRATLADIGKADKRAAAVIDRMRGLLQRRTIDTRRLDVDALAGEVASLVRMDAAARQVKLDVHVPGDLPQIRGDRVHLQQVLLNLMLNGMDAQNGARLEDRRVSITARPDGADSVEIAVTDAGPGIPADTFARLFEPFFTTKPTGMGMGLAISRTIVEAHGGRLWAENLSGGGAAFRFTVPIADETDAA